MNDDSPTVFPSSGGGAVPPSADPGSTQAPGSGGTRHAPLIGLLRVGENFGSRYHIIRPLGVGGMGAVYQAWDQVLEVAVAVKVIRPDATIDPIAAQEIERRFKRELLLARQVTHKNVVRIHDLGEIDGITYITMPYVQGSDLSTILKRDGRIAVDRALAIAREVAAGLAAAHDAGVVHRDLKPANIMIDGEGGAIIMDFGIARSTSGATGMGMTAAGVIVGTVEYMAPEQARGEAVDERADVYSFGLILNDLLLGRRQGGTSGVTELMARMLQAPASIRSIDPTIPTAVDALVTRCVHPDPASRYQHMREVLAALELLDSNGHPQQGMTAGAVVVPAIAGSVPVVKKRWAAAVISTASVLAAVAGAGWVVKGRVVSQLSGASSTVASPAISLAVLPFRNASSDPTLETLGVSVSEVLRSELGQSSRVRTVPSDRLTQVLQDLRIGANATLSPSELTRVADLTSARSVLSGQVARFGTAIRIDATLQDLDGGQVVPLNAMAANDGSVLTAIAGLADTVRQNLSHGSRDILKELQSSAWKPSTNSIDALRMYNEGVQLAGQGKSQEALKRLEAATAQDSQFALAFSELARAYATLGYDTEAARFSRRAMELAEALPPQEKYLIAAHHYQIVNDTRKAIESYENLTKASPTNTTVRFDLGGLYEQRGDFEQAEQQFTKVVELDPTFVEGLRALGRVEIRRGNPQLALDHLNKALSLAIQVENAEARANVLQAIGIAYKGLNRPEEALRRYEESLEIKRKLGQKRGMAASLNGIAQIQGPVLGKPRDAEQSYEEALKLQREIGDKSGMSATLTDLAVLLNESLGRPNDALPLLQEALQIRRDTGNQSGEALVLNNIGNVYLSKGQFSEARTYFERALEIRQKAKVPREIADTQHNLAETLAKMGRYDESLSDYLGALELRRASGDRRGVAIESYSIGTIFDYQGRYGAAVKSKQEALATFRELKQREMWLGEILSGYGNSLSLSGRTDDAARSLDEAMTVARELQNPSLIAQTTLFESNRFYYSGDTKAAIRLAEQASDAAAKASDRGLMLLARAAVAMTSSSTQPSRALVAQLATIAQQADGLGLQFLSVQCSLQRAETLLKLGDRSGARQEVERSLAKAEALGFRLLLAQARYLRATLLRLGGDADSSREYASALRVLEEMKGEEGNQDILKRPDLNAMHADCTRWSKAA